MKCNMDRYNIWSMMGDYCSRRGGIHWETRRLNESYVPCSPQPVSSWSPLPSVHKFAQKCKKMGKGEEKRGMEIVERKRKRRASASAAYGRVRERDAVSPLPLIQNPFLTNRNQFAIHAGHLLETRTTPILEAEN